MKTLPPGLATLLASGVTTLCRCWRLTRVDAAVFGFTDHDRVLTIAGENYAPQTGFTASEMTSALGLAVDTMNVEGALSSDAITETDIALGLWDNAEVTILIVDWSNTANRVIIRQGNLGELTRGDVAMQAEIRSLAHVLNQEQGRTYQRLCDAVVGDTRCGVDLSLPQYAGSGVVIAAEDDRYLTAIGLGGFASGWFTQGVLRWTSGANAGARIELRNHQLSAAIASLSLWQRAAQPIVNGDGFAVTVGCARTFGVCRAKFANAANFRGFPHIPGNDFAMGVVKQDASNDGGSFFN